MGVATFSFVFATLCYYGSALSWMSDAERVAYYQRGDRFWMLRHVLLFSVGPLAAGSAWLALWLVYLLFAIRYFRIYIAPRSDTVRPVKTR